MSVEGSQEAFQYSTYTWLMSPWRKILAFSILRLVVFALPFAILMMFGIIWWASAAIAAIVGLCLSYLFLHNQRNEVAAALEQLRSNSSKDADSDLENEALDREEAESKKRS